MTLDELRAHLQVTDFEFGYNSKHYFICPLQVFSDFSAGEADHDPKNYKTFDELMSNFIIEGKPLKEIIRQIEPY